MRILVVIALASVGLLFGFWFWQISDNLSAGAWERLIAPPGEIVELIPSESNEPLYIKTSDGITYRYEEWQNRGWVEETIPEVSINPTEIQRPCDPSAPEFSRFSNPPHDIVDCVQQKVMYADGFIRYTFVLDRQGYLWQSRITSTAYDSISALLVSLGFGLLFGLVVGMIIPIPLWREKDAKPFVALWQKRCLTQRAPDVWESARF